MKASPWLVVALAGGLLGADQVRSQAEVTVLELQAKRTLMSAPATPAVGLGFVSGGDLYAADGRTRVGEGYSHCGVLSVSTAVPPGVTAHCTTTFRLQDGELHLSSLRTYQDIASGFGDTPMAIVGGTGVYANARGEGQATRSTSPDVGYRFTFTIVQ